MQSRGWTSRQRRTCGRGLLIDQRAGASEEQSESAVEVVPGLVIGPGRIGRDEQSGILGQFEDRPNPRPNLIGSTHTIALLPGHLAAGFPQGRRENLDQPEAECDGGTFDSASSHVSWSGTNSLLW